MKKIIVCIFICFFLGVCIDIKSSDNNEILMIAGSNEIADEYYNNSKNFKYDYVFPIDKIIISTELIDESFDNCTFEYVYNIFGQVQYVLIESIKNSRHAIFDLMLLEVIEYSNTTSSLWKNNNLMDKIKIYYSPSELYYLSDNVFYDARTFKIVNIEKNASNFNCLDEINIIDYRSFSFGNRLIREKKDINNYQYFQYIDTKRNSLGSDVRINNHMYPNTITHSSTFNNGHSCTIVAATMLLGFYDTYYNNNIVPQQINDSIGIYDYASFKEFNQNVYYEINNIDLVLTQESNYSIIDKKIGDFIVEPSENLHDHLYYIAHNIDNQYSFTPIDLCDILGDYLDNLSLSNSFSDYYLITNFNVKSKLDSNIPIIMGYFGHTYYYGGSENPTSNAFADHAVIAYGYEETNIGRFYHVNMGWDRIYNDTYLNVSLFGSYFWMEYSGTHVCSSNYGYNESYPSVIEFTYCPACYSFNDFFTYDGIHSDDLSHDYFYLNSDPTKLMYVLHNYTLGEDECYDNNYHYNICYYCNQRLLDSLNNEVLVPHNFKICNSTGTINHLFECIDCGFELTDSHTLSNYIYLSSNYCAKYCAICDETYETTTHNYTYYGNIFSHYKKCTLCNNEISCSETNYTISQYSDIRHQYICDCGFVQLETHTLDANNDCICGYHHSNHVYTYEQFNSLKHKRNCYCGVSSYESHSFVDYHGILKCSKCGYETDDFVPINSRYAIIRKINILDYKRKEMNCNEN